MFKQTVKSETTAVQRYVDAVLEGESLFAENREYAQTVVTSSDVNSLIGVSVRDVWTGPDGTVYALAQMNRRESASRYSSLIRENEAVVSALMQYAAENRGTFEAFNALDFAYAAALVNDGFLDILSVLDYNARAAASPDYGNADSVKKAAAEAAGEILVGIHIVSDADAFGRIGYAFASLFADRGFKTVFTDDTADTFPARYLLDGNFTVEDIEMNSKNQFVRYTLTAALRDVMKNTVLVPYSVSGREGHLTSAEAKQRAVRTAEQQIQKTFADSFQIYFDALL